MGVLGEHGELSCRVRINWSWIFAKWHHRGSINLLKKGIIRGLFAKETTLTFRSEKLFLFSVNQPSSPHLNPNLSSLSKISLSTQPLSLFLFTLPAEARRGGAAARHHSRAAARGPRAAAQARRPATQGRRQAASGLARGEPCLAKNRERFQIFGIVS